MDELPELTANHCRICLLRCDDTANDVAKSIEAYKRISGFTIESFDIPRKICQKCCAEIEQIETFLDHCLITETILAKFQQIPSHVEPQDVSRPVQVVSSPLESTLAEIVITAPHRKRETNNPVRKQRTPKHIRPNFELIKNDDVGICEQFVLLYETKIDEQLPESQDKDVYESTREFGCDFCEFNGTSKKTLAHHIIEFHKEQQKLECTNCNTIFLSQTHYEIHLKEDQNREKCAGNYYFIKDVLTCAFCDVKHPKFAYMKYHFAKSHADRKWFKCPYCIFESFSLDRMRSHSKRHKQELKPFTALSCDFCTFKCNYQVNMEIHYQKFHPQNRISCECGAFIVCRDLVLQHLLVRCPKASDMCKLPYFLFLNSEPKDLESCMNLTQSSKLLTDEGKLNIICELCGKAVNRNGMFLHKLKYHSDAQRKYHCDLCGNAYSNKCDVKWHIETKHLNLVKFSCKYCDRNFSNWTSRKYHIQTNHEQHKQKYHCETCGLKFPNRYKLECHASKHSVSKEIPCKICDKNFKSKSALETHIRGVHSEKSYKCPLCPSIYAGGQNLKHHIKAKHPEFELPPVGTTLRNVDLSIYVRKRTNVDKA